MVHFGRNVFNSAKSKKMRQQQLEYALRVARVIHRHVAIICRPATARQSKASDGHVTYALVLLSICNYYQADQKLGTEIIIQTSKI